MDEVLNMLSTSQLSLFSMGNLFSIVLSEGSYEAFKSLAYNLKTHSTCRIKNNFHNA